VVGLEDPQVLGDAHLGGRAVGRVSDLPVGRGVAADHVPQYLAGGEEVLLLRVPEPHRVAVVGVDVGLVDGHPQRHQVPQCLDAAAGVPAEGLDDLVVLPAADVRQPHRVGEVVQGDHRGHATVPERAHHLAVVVQRGRVELAAPGLDPAPLQRQAVGVVAHPTEEVEVLAEADVVLAGVPAAIPGLDLPGPLLPAPPVAVAVVPFNLVRGRGGAPEEALTERVRRWGQRRRGLRGHGLRRQVR